MRKNGNHNSTFHIKINCKSCNLQSTISSSEALSQFNQSFNELEQISNTKICLFFHFVFCGCLYSYECDARCIA